MLQLKIETKLNQRYKQLCVKFLCGLETIIVGVSYKSIKIFFIEGFFLFVCFLICVVLKIVLVTFA